jgi:5-methylcytosine-specific restriction protein A
MPTKPRLLGGRPKVERERSYETRRRQAHPWRAWYSLPVWKRRRADQLAREPLCERCRARDVTTAATVANHRVPHRGDWDLFIAGDLESLCGPCHNAEVQAEERAAARAEARRRGVSLD